MGTGADVAIETSGLTLECGDLRVVSDAIRLSRKKLATVKGNLCWAFTYNIAALPVAGRVMPHWLTDHALGSWGPFWGQDSNRVQHPSAIATAPLDEPEG
jgi:cation transport ATPase